MNTVLRSSIFLAASAGLILILPSCESNGGQRFASVGVQGEPGPAGRQGASGDQGKQGAEGKKGQSGGMTLSNTSALAVGGLVGPSGIAGTGLLANTGDPNSNPPVLAAVEVQSGELVNILAPETLKVASLVDNALPGSTPIAGTVVGVLQAAGQTLIQTGNGDAYLVDGLVAAPGELITAMIGQTAAIGSEDAQSLIGSSLLSPGGADGQLATLGLDSAGQLVALSGAGPIDQLAQPATSLIDQATNMLQGADGAGAAGAVLTSAEQTVGGAVDAAKTAVGDVASGDAGGAVSDVVGAVSSVGGTLNGATGAVTDATGSGSSVLDLTGTGATTGALDAVTGTVDGLLGGTVDSTTQKTDGALGKTVGKTKSALGGLLGGPKN